MRLLYICARYAPGAYAGGELSAHTALRGLAEAHGVDVLVATDGRYIANARGQDHFEGIRLAGVPLADPEPRLKQIVADFDPNVIYTQPPWHDTALRLGEAFKIPTVLRAPDLSALQLVTDGTFSPTVIIAQTQQARDAVKSAGGRTVMLPAFIDLARAKSAAEKNRKYITMFNPVEYKGGYVFREIAQRMPEQSFAVVPGWFSLRNEQGAFDPQVIAAGRPRPAHSQPKQESYAGWIPQEANFASLQNVTVLQPRDTVSEIYDVTRLLLVPSQEQDQFPRVIFEAAANGAPVIASGTDSLRENAGDAALYVDNYQSPDEWVTAIRCLDDEGTYSDRRERGRQFVTENYSLEQAIAQLHSVISEIARDNRRNGRLKRLGNWITARWR